MMILVVNAGSSSLKCALFEMPARRVLASGQVERIGQPDARLSLTGNGLRVGRPCRADDHEQALAALMQCLVDGKVVSDVAQVEAVGHRVVHGGDMTHSVVVDDGVLETIRRCAVLAPLHNPPNLAGLAAASHMLPGRPQVAVFDTAFHSSMPPCAYLYAVPWALYEERRVRAYGFHGTSHRYVAARAAELLGRPAEEVNLITLHLGNGCSAAAVRAGRSVDTSMGLTPLQGLVMGTRCGDVDPGLFFFLSQWLDMSPGEVYDLLNKQSGLAGLSGVGNDMREILRAAEAGSKRAALTLDVFAYRVRKYIGAYWAVLGRVHGVVFTAGIGENSSRIRRMVCAGLEEMGLVLDEARNEAAAGAEAVISAEQSSVCAMVIPTNEELQIAVETYDVLCEGQHS